MQVWDSHSVKMCGGRATTLLLCLAALVLLSTPAAAQVITYTSVRAEWRDPQDNLPGVQAGDPAITNGIPTSSVSWGGATPQSGYDITIEIVDPTQPPVADFVHRNFTVPSPSLTQITLDLIVGFEIDGDDSLSPLTFTYTFTHEETPNNLDPCPYPTPPGEGCTDRVVFLDAPIPTTFTIGGKTYTLGMTFLDGNGDPIDEFITNEGGVANSTELDVEFQLVPPVFEVIKSGPGTLAAGQAGVFTIDAQNVGPNDAWYTTITDALPNDVTGGLCDATPQVLSAQVFAANGSSTVPGKGPLVQGTDFTLSHVGAPTCELTLSMLTPQSAVGENERLIITYQTQLDGGTQFGASLTNVAGATSWWDDEVSGPLRTNYVETLSDGTVGTVDHEDAHTVNTGLLDYLFEKTVHDPVTDALLTEAVPGETVRYRLRVENRTASPLVDLAFTDLVDDLNVPPVFEPGSLTLVSWPTGSDTSGTNPAGGVVDVRDISVAPGASEVLEFDLTIATLVPEGTLATNQAVLLAAGAPLASSDDPNVNLQADPFVDGDEDPTVFTIVYAPAFLVEKTWADLTGDPAVLRPGDTLRYTITAKNVGTDDAFDSEIRDALPANTTYVVGSTTLNGSPVPDGPGLTLPLAGGMPIHAPENPTPGTMRADPSATPDNVATIQFDVVVDGAVADGTVISNQAFVSAVAGGVVDQPSDDPGTPLADDPTLVTVSESPPDPLLKDITQPSAAVGELFSYRVTIPQNPHPYTLYDVRILDDLTTSAADLRFVSVSRISGTTPWTPENTGSPTALVIEDTSTGIDIPAGDQIELEIFVVLEDTGTNTTGLVFANTAGYTHNWTDGDPGTQAAGIDGVSPDMTIEAPDLVMSKSGPPGLPGSAIAVYTLDVQNVGGASAWNPTLLDQIANPTPGGMCDVPPAAISAQVFQSDGATAVGPVLVEGGDFTALFAPDPTCELTLQFIGPAISIAPTERLIVTYELRLDADTPNDTDLTNVAGAIEWFTADGSNPATAGDRRTVTETLTDGTVGTPDHEDAHTTTTILPLVRFEKTVEDALAPAGPITQASPGDRLRYTIVIENVGSTPLDAFTFRDEADRLNLGQPAFDPGSLGNFSIPSGASLNADPGGGSAGTGSIEVTGLDLPNNGDIATIVFEIDLAPALPNGLVVQNQAELSIGGIPFWMSDDPNINGAALPNVVGDEDPTAFTIVSAPSFLVEKTSADLTGDPAVLRAGDTLRYTITVKNVGDEDVIDALIRDAVPVNTAYVAGSTFLNGSPVAEAPAGTLPLVGGMLINAPENPTPGAMRADASATPDNVATIRFDVVVDPGVADGTILSNQAFVSAVTAGVVDQPSDDPDTVAVDDPTRDVVGDSPLLFASKDAVLWNDVDGDGVPDPGDTLQYVILVSNTGAVDATGVTLQDAVPTNAVYRDDTLTLNGAGVGQPDGGVSPLIAGIDISSSDLPPPAAGAGTISPGESATVVFQVDITAGPQVVNQAQVTSNEGGVLLTDGDGNPSTGPEPTVVVVGDVEQLAITKQVTVVGGGAALPGSLLEYVVRVSNVGNVPATGVLITDDLNAPVAGQLVYEPGSATLQGAAGGVTWDGVGLLTADYGSTYGPLPVGADAVLRFRATLAAGLSLGELVQNDALVTWGTPAQNDTGTVIVTVGGMPGAAALSGTLWHDADFDGAIDVGEAPLAGWLVDLLRNGQVVLTVTADASGAWSMSGLATNDVSGEPVELRFRAPDAGPASASLGTPVSPFTNGPQQITNVVLTSGSVLPGVDLPITPNGVVYGSIVRTNVAGATLRLLDAASGTPVAASCFADPVQQGQITRGDGRYKFDLVFGQPSCPSSGGDYLIDVTPPAAGYVAGASTLIPPVSDATTTAFDTPSCGSGPNDAVPATPQHCEVQPSEFGPPTTVPAGSTGTNHYLHLTFDSSIGEPSAQIFNNHIALDSDGSNILALSKTTPKVNVSIGDLIPYEIVLRNDLSVDLPSIDIVDRYPAGFRYVEGSARIDDGTNVVETEPTIDARELTWVLPGVEASGQRRVVMLLAVGAGVTEGEFVNRVVANDNASGIALSGEATATVRVVPDPDFACTDVLGKVFDDGNRNGYQDSGEIGIPGVRLVTPRGLVATTDAHGRYHITCAVTPRDGIGSNFVLKLDDRSLPTGYRMSTRQSLVKRATQGKALRMNFGASIDRVVGLDLADAVFEPQSTTLRDQWKPRLELLIEELAKAPARLRLTYVADVEEETLVKLRLDAVETAIREAWSGRGGESHAEEGVDADALKIESEIFWRLGAPNGHGPDGQKTSSAWSRFSTALGDIGESLDADSRNGAEQLLPTEHEYTLWTQDASRLATERGDRLEEREVLADVPETVKLKNVVPPVRFESGVADIPPSTIDTLRVILDGMRHLDDVRLHLTGHSDDQPLSGELASRYGDNEGLSRERSGEVAEFIQSALSLPPDAISYSWAGASQPMASNDTEAGRALNRRVEIEVWHDEMRKKLAVEDVVIPEEITRVKVCRMETVCKLRLLDGHARRARVKNLIAPLNYDDDGVQVTPAFIRQVREAMANLQNKQNVTVKFIGYTDNAALSQRNERIYGTHTALSKARARRVALTIQETLSLPSAAVTSDGRGASRPVASNELPLGRSLNRRVEVEFWYDDPLQELPDEPMMCPDAADTEMLVRVYDPSWGRLEPLRFEGDDIAIPEGYADGVRRAMSDVQGKPNVRVRFVGYTSNERLDRRTAMVYGDDIGLSAARARRTMERLQAEMGLDDSQVEHEGRGYLFSNDVVNAGFIQNDVSQVLVEVVYDEPAVLDDYEGVAITPITRELKPKSPLDLNLMRISVDGEPIDDPGRSSADIQRCTDVALEDADLRFRFDSLVAHRRLSVTADVGAVLASRVAALPGAAEADASETPAPSGIEDGSDAESAPASPLAASGASTARFEMYSNYSHFIERAEVRIFDRDQSLRAEPLGVAEIGSDGLAEWTPPDEPFPAPKRELKYVLRVYDAEGRFDETAPQPLWVVYAEGVLTPFLPADGSAALPAAMEDDASGSSAEATVASGGGRTPILALEPGSLLAGYGESGPLLTNIPLGGAGTVTVHGTGVPSNHSVWVAGRPVPVDEKGDFIAEALLPTGLHTVEVNMLDAEGNGELFLRDLAIDPNDWFYMGIADLTFTVDLDDDRDDSLSGKNSRFDDDSWADGRFAFYVNGKFADDWKLTASADTREGSLEDLFSNFTEKSHESLFRTIDEDYHYPTFGDEGTVEETAPTLGKFYVKLAKDRSHAMWGNFKVSYTGNELALVERGLYGGSLHYESPETTSFGEQRMLLDGFAADPGTVPARDEFRGTGGSLYYLRHQDLLQGSDRLRVELRDKDSGLVTGVVTLREGLDYDIDYIQGRVLLSEPINATVADQLLVRDDGLSGNEAWLVAQYEYTPGFKEIDTLATGGRGHYWFGDFLKLGVTASRNDEDGTDSSLYAGDVTVRMSTQTWLKLQAGWSEGQVSTAARSDDGGFDFFSDAGLVTEDADALGYRADASIGFEDLFGGGRGQMSLYAQILEGGYTAPGLTTLTDLTQFGAALQMPVVDRVHIVAKADRLEEDDGLETTTAEVDVAFELTEHWSLSAGVRYDDREDNAPVVASTQEEGTRTDAVVQVGYDSKDSWSSYAFGQATVASTGNREDNVRGGVGGELRVTERFAMTGEVSHGDLGPAAQLGSDFQTTERTRMYLTYALDNERGADGAHARRGNLVGGATSRVSDSATVFVENRYQHAKSESGLTRAVGIDFAPNERWSLSGNVEIGTLSDRRTRAETERRAISASVSYHIDSLLLSSGIEYLYDDTKQDGGGSEDRTTWLFRNALKYQMTPDWKLVAKLNHSLSSSSLGDFFDGDFTEAVLGYAYRPVAHDRLNALVKYTYFYNFPTAGQIGPSGSQAEFAQRSHIAALDVMYDLTPDWSVGGKYAYRLSQVSLDREDPEYFDNDAHLGILRTDYRFLEDWEGLVEGRILYLPDLDEHKAGALLTLYRYLGEHFKVGVGYNFTDFSEDLTDLSYDHHGWLFNMVGTF